MRLTAALILASMTTLVGCTGAPPADAVTFRTYLDPQVGGFCANYAEDQPGQPCVDRAELIAAAHPELTIGDGHHLVEVTAKVSKTTQQRRNSANPPQTTTMSVWVIEQVYAAKAVN